MNKKIKELNEQNMKLRSQMSAIMDKAKAEKRVLTDEEKVEMEQYRSQYEMNEMEISDLNQMDIAQRNAQPQEQDVNVQLRSFLKNAKAGDKFEFAPTQRAAMATTDTTPYVQGVSVQDIISTERPDGDIFAAAGINIITNVTGNKIQWPFMGGVEAVFANELAKTTERKIDLDEQSPVQQRLTVRVRVSQQSIENSNFDLQALFTSAVERSIREKINWAAVSTTKATTTFFGGFAQATETGTYGNSGYKAGKQAGTYATLDKTVFLDAIKKLASRNIPLKNAVFVLGSEDYWDAKVTPVDAGSGIMLLGNDGRILGIPVIENNAINKATEKGAASGHNIGLGCFGAMPVMQHGSIRLSVDGSSALAADTDEVIITINADFSMTILKSMADAFVVMSKSSAAG